MMNKIRAVVIDDETRARKILTSLLHDFLEDVEVVGEADSVIKGREVIRELNPDLVFLDVEMPGGNGFSLLNSFNDINFEVVFTTAYSEYALEAIKQSAIDYLLKPVDIQELKTAIEKFKKRHHNSGSVEGSVYFLPQDLSFNKNQETKIILPVPKGFKIVALKSIFYCEASGSYTTFFIDDGRITVARQLKFFEEKLSKYNFFRIHDSFIINLHFIDSYLRGRGGAVMLKTGQSLPVSRGKRQALLDRFSTSSL